MRCDMEMCPMWDGNGCPCGTFDLDRNNLPNSGVFTIEFPSACEDAPLTRLRGDGPQTYGPYVSGKKED